MLTDKNSNLGNIGIRISYAIHDMDVNISSGCTPKNGLPTVVETIVLVKKGLNVYLNNDKLAKINTISELDKNKVVG